MLIQQVDGQFKITFAYRQHLVDAVKTLPGRKYNGVDKAWYVPQEHSAELALFAKRFGFNFSGEVKPYKLPDIVPMPELTIDIGGLLKKPEGKEPFPFQLNGIAYGMDETRGLRYINGDKPGLGKTLQSIATVTVLEALTQIKTFPCLVICPNTLKTNWQREWGMWTDHRAMILTDSIKKTWQLYYDTGMADVFIVNYESLKKFFVHRLLNEEGEKLKISDIEFKETIKLFNSIIVDESHRCKNSRTQQTKYTTGIARGKQVVIALTGTPIVNKPVDLAAQLRIIGRLGDFGGWKSFNNRYCGGEKEASNLQELNVQLRNICFYSREKTDVLKDLPAKMRQVIYCELDAAHRQEYAVAENDLRVYLQQFQNKTAEEIEKSMRGEIMVRITKLKGITARGKLRDVFEYIDDTIEQGQKMVVFGHLKEVLDQVKRRYPTQHVSITGDDDNYSRQQSIDRFQNNEAVKLCVCSIKAGGVGITLTASSIVGFIEQDWHAAIHDQAEDRCHRIGQHDSVQCPYFLARNTIDEWNYELIEEKREMAKLATGGTEQVEVSVIDRAISLFNNSTNFKTATTNENN